MSLLTPLRGTRRRALEPPPGSDRTSLGPPSAPARNSAAAAAVEWHVGLSLPGMFPEHEVGCPCPKAPCGLALLSPDPACGTHQPRTRYLQAHSALDCNPRKWFHRIVAPPGRRPG